MHLPELGQLAADGVGRITRALIDLDPDEARAVAAADDEIDRLYHAIIEETKALMAADGGTWSAACGSSSPPTTSSAPATG